MPPGQRCHFGNEFLQQVLNLGRGQSKEVPGKVLEKGQLLLHCFIKARLS